MATIVFIMDPIQFCDPDKDTTLGLMMAAYQSGDTVVYVPEAGVSLIDQHVCFEGAVVTFEEPYCPIVSPKTQTWSADQVTIVFLRLDPPVSLMYQSICWMLMHLPSHVHVSNHPSSVQRFNEKMMTLQASQHHPKTVVTADKQVFEKFIQHEKRVVIKPIDQYGGAGIFVVDANDRNRMAMFESVSCSGKEPVMIQAFVAASEEGDKRILLVHGKPIGAILRVHSPSDYRNNMKVGGSVHPAKISKSDAVIIHELVPFLRQHDLTFVGLDVLGAALTEINITSPTGLREVALFSGEDPQCFEKKIYQKLCKRAPIT